MNRKLKQFLIKEAFITGLAFLYGIFHPTYKLDDVPEPDRPTNNSYLVNNLKYQKIRSPLKVVSWNIMRFYNQDKIKNSLEFFIREYDPDIFFIQEASVCEDFKFSDLSIFKKFNKLYAPLHQMKKQYSYYNFKSTGNLILSKYNFSKTKVYELPTVSIGFLRFVKGHIGKRIAVYGQIEKGNKKIGLYNVHLENACLGNGRRKQIEYLYSVIEENSDDIIIIGGDFNTFCPNFFETGLGFLESKGFIGPLFKKYRIKPCLDHFLVWGSSCDKKKLFSKGSDHQPVMINIKI